ncbi:MAG: hypothetical protein AAB354_15005 [candidate division KSB1 bacterium]|mgnify:CR=1 FL=1
MFAGHFAIALALKARYRDVPLAALLFAAQLCDVLWLVLTALNVEHYRLYFALNGTLHLDLYEVPYSHAFFWTAFYALQVFLLFVRAEGQRHWAVPLSLAVLSHWFLDWLVCAPILPFANFGPEIKFGAKLAHIFPFAGLMIEAVIVFACWRVYERRLKETVAGKRWERGAILVLLTVLLLAPEILRRVY